MRTGTAAFGSGWDQLHGSGVERGEVLDNRARLEHGRLAIDEQRELGDWPAPGQLRAILQVIGIEHPEFKWRFVLVKRDQRFHRVGREGMAEELQGHASGSPARARSMTAMSIPLHPHHRIHGAPSCCLVGIGHGAEERAGHDLPGQTELVLAPTALRLGTTIADDRVPVAVGLLLAVSVDLEADGLIEFDSRPAIETHERRAQHGELDEELITLLAARVIGRRSKASVQLAVGKDRNVELGRLARLATVEQ